MKIGDEINYWTYIRKSKKKYYGFFRCKCGTERELRIRNVKNEWSKSCSCIVRDKTDQNYIGKRYGRLVILDTIRKNNEITHFHCRCDCGKETDWQYLTNQEKKNRNIIVFRAPADVEDPESPDLEEAEIEVWSGK